MITLQLRKIPQSSDCFFPKKIFLVKEFKSLVNHLVERLGVVNGFNPRLYTHFDYIMVKLYAIARGISTEIASESLNAYLMNHYKTKYHLNPKKYSDGFRKRRFIPHRTEVDKYFRRLSDKGILNLFGNLNMEICRKIIPKRNN